MIRYRRLIEAVFSGETTETCPVFFWKHHPELDQDAASLAAATLAFQGRFDCDLVKISPAATYQLPDYGLLDAWRGDPIGRRTILRTVIQTPEDWKRLPRLDPHSGFTGRLVSCVGMVRRDLTTEMPLTITVFNPLFQAATLAGVDRLRRHMIDDPDALERGLEMLLANTLDLIARLVSAEVDGIFLASQHAEQTTFSAAQYERFGLPGDLACLSAAKCLPFNMLHLHGERVHKMMFEHQPGLTLHYDASLGNPPPQDRLADGGSVSTGPGPALLALDGPTSAVTEACDAVLMACKGRGFVLSPGCSVPLAVPDERMHAITAAARRSRPDRSQL